MIHLDTSMLIDALTGTQRSAKVFYRAVESGERMALSALVLYEWIRGPRAPEELAIQEALFPAAGVVSFGPREAEVAATLFGSLPRARRRDFDLCIAACALTHQATLWTLNPGDFRDIPDLALFSI